MGYRSRMKYGIVGADANVPSKLEELNKTYGTSCLISESTKSMLPQGVFLTRPVDYVHLRNTKDEIAEPIHEVMGSDGAHSDMQALAEEYAQALHLYRSRDFE